MPRKYVLLITVTLAVIGLDQWTKYRVVSDLTTRLDGLSTLSARLHAFYGKAPPEGFDGMHFRTKHFVTVSEKYFRIRYAENPGAAWGLFRTLPEHIRGPLFDVVVLGAVLFIVYSVVRLRGRPEERWMMWGLPLVLGGALGNYIDRLARRFVVDFLEAHWMDKAAWPSFNIADSAICIGVALLMLDAFLRREKPA